MPLDGSVKCHPQGGDRGLSGRHSPMVLWSGNSSLGPGRAGMLLPPIDAGVDGRQPNGPSVLFARL